MGNSNLLSDPDRLLSREELAEAIGVPIKTLRNWASLDKGPRRMRVGKYIRYRASDVKTWLDGQYCD